MASYSEAMKYAAENTVEPEKPMGNGSPDTAMDDAEASANLVTMFSSVCKAAAMAPKDALAILVAHDFGDDLDAALSRFRVV
jgi:hypothetical protein